MSNGTGYRVYGSKFLRSRAARPVVVAVSVVAFAAVSWPAVAAHLGTSTAAGSAGSVYVADTFGDRLVKVAGGGQATVQQHLNLPNGVAVDAAGNVYVADSRDNRVVRISPDGARRSIGSGLNSPYGVTVDSAGDVYIADTDNGRVLRIPASGGPQTTVGTGLSNPTGVALDKSGNVYIADPYNNQVVEVPADGGPQTTVTIDGLADPTNMAFDAAGDLYVADPYNNRIVKVPAGGGKQTTVGTGLNFPTGVAVDTAGNVYIADFSDSRVVEVPANGGAQTTVGTNLNYPYEVAVPPSAASAAGPQAAPATGADSATANYCTSTSHPALAARLSHDIRSALAGRQSTLAFTVWDNATGVTCAVNPTLHFDSASVVKVTIMGATLRRAQDEHRSLTPTEVSDLNKMITQSDNTAASDLWNSLGIAKIQDFLRLSGMNNTVPNDAWGLTQITAADEVKQLTVFTTNPDVLTPANKAYGLSLMSQVEADQRWGTPYGAPAGVTVQVKNGWLQRATHGWRVNSLGVFTAPGTLYQMAVLTQDSPTEAYGIATIQAIAWQVHHDLNQSSKQASALPSRYNPNISVPELSDGSVPANRR